MSAPPPTRAAPVTGQRFEADLLLTLVLAHERNQLKNVMQRAINAYRLLIVDLCAAASDVE